MRFRYRNEDEMKDSGIELIGEIPTNWKVCKWRYITEILTDYTANGSFGDLAKNVKYLDYKEYARLVRLVDLRVGLKNEGVYVNENAYKYLSKSKLEGGEFLIANVGANSGFICKMPLVEYPCTLAPNMMMAKFKKELIDNDFMIYSGSSHNIQLQLGMKSTQSSAQPKLNKDDFREVLFVLPPKVIQEKIVEFLDEKIVGFNLIISKKEELIEKLEESKKSLISEVITGKVKVVKTDDAYQLEERKKEEMKDSEIEWISKIPNEWKITKTTNIIKFSKGLTITKDDLRDEGIPCINYGEIHSKYKFEVDPNINKLKYIDPMYLEKNPLALLKKGEFVFCDTSEDIEGCGNFTYLNSDTNILAGYHTIIGRPISKINSRYIAYLFEAKEWRAQIRSKVYGVKVYSISQSILKETKVILPSQEEQTEIVQYVDNKILSINSIIGSLKSQIIKLKEAKESLISEAVTGKIEILD